MKIYKTIEYSNKLPMTLALLDASCFENEVLNIGEWTKFFESNEDWFVCWIQDDNNKTIGIAVVTYVYGHIAYLYSIAVEVEHRGDNLSGLLLTEIIGFLNNKVSTVQAHTRANNKPIIRQLSKFNFNATQFIPDLFGDFEDGVLWELKIK